MKKFVVTCLIWSLSMSCATATNVLLENQKYKQELNIITTKQKQENGKQILYYKGKPDYIVLPSSSKTLANTKKVYEKKGIRFKKDNSLQTEEENKVKVEQKTEQGKSEVKSVKNENKPAESNQGKNVEKNMHHNEDAE